MRVFISTQLFDLDGDLELSVDEFTDDQSASRRVTRTPTLDGSAALVDQGATDADLTFTIETTATEAIATQLRAILTGHSAVSVTTRAGFFSGVLAAMASPAGGKVSVQFLPVVGVR